eukprot:g1948.t1
MPTKIAAKAAVVQGAAEKAVVKNVVNFTLNEIAYIRGLFPSELFERKTFKSGSERDEQSSIVHVFKKPGSSSDGAEKHEEAEACGDNGKQHDVSDDDMRGAQMFTKWIQQGIYDAIDREYLRCLCFCVYEGDGTSDATANERDLELFECYQYNFKYPENGRVESSVTISSAGRKRSNNQSHIKQQLQLMFRSVCSMCSSLPPTPKHRTLSVKLYYYEDITPADYQPPCFRDGDEEDTTLLCRQPLEAVPLGKVYTKNHGIALKLWTPAVGADAEDAGAGGADGSDEELTQFTLHPLASETDSEEVAARGEREQRRVERALVESAAAKFSAVRIADGDAPPPHPHADDSLTQAPAYDDELLRKLREYITQTNRPVLKECLSEFPAVSAAAMRAAFARLCDENLIRKERNSSYRMTRMHVSSAVRSEERSTFNAAIVALFDDPAGDRDGFTYQALERKCHLPPASARTLLQRFEELGLVTAPRNKGGKVGPRRFVVRNSATQKRLAEARAYLQDASEGTEVAPAPPPRAPASASVYDYEADTTEPVDVPLSQQTIRGGDSRRSGKRKSSSSVSLVQRSRAVRQRHQRFDDGVSRV